MNKKNTRLWGLSLFLNSVIAVILAVCNIAAIDLPDVAVRIIGVIEICIIPILVFTSIKMYTSIKKDS